MPVREPERDGVRLGPSRKLDGGSFPALPGNEGRAVERDGVPGNTGSCCTRARNADSGVWALAAALRNASSLFDMDDDGRETDDR